MNYHDFLERKTTGVESLNRTVSADEVNPYLHQWQREIVAWAATTGRAAVWADTGLGKTLMQLEWSRIVADGGTALIVAPLAVCEQTSREARKVGIDARYVRSGDDIGPGVWITNYEMVEHFDPTKLDAVVLDEASILKQSNGKTRTRLIQHFAPVRYRLAATATPAPNDPEELTNQAEFLGVATRVNMLAAYFIHDSDGWRLKGHARKPMYQWMSSWAVAIRRPSDMGYPDDGYGLPGLNIIPHLLDVNVQPEDQLFATDLGGVGGRAKIRKQTLHARCAKTVEIVNESHGLSEVSNKLAACGSPNTLQTGEQSTQQARKSGIAGDHRGELPSRTANTCGTTTNATSNDSRSTSGKLGIGETRADASDTPTTRNIGRSASDSASSATRSQSATTGCESPSASRRPNTTHCSPSNKGDAQSAEPQNQPESVSGSTSITTTKAATSADCSARNAISGSASSGTTQTSSESQSNTSLEPWVIWCGLNAEQEYLHRAFGDRCFSLTGSQSPEEKVELLYRWLDGERPILLTKPSIAGMGINMQHCARMAFVGLSDSYEAYYQSIRRCYRYGQTRVVDAHIVLSELESQIAANVARKEREASNITASLVAEMRANKREMVA